MLYSPKSINGFRRLATSYDAFNDYCIDTLDGEILLTLRPVDWRRSIRFAAVIGGFSSVLTFMYWRSQPDLFSLVIFGAFGLLITSLPLAIPVARHLIVPHPCLRANIAERHATIVKFPALNALEQIQRALGCCVRSDGLQRTISIDDIAGFCDVLEEGLESCQFYSELQVVLMADGERTCQLLAKSLINAFDGTPANIFTPLAQSLATQIGVTHYSVDLVRDRLLIDGQSVAEM